MWKTLAVKQRVVWFIMSTRININLPVSASQGRKQRERGGWFDGGGYEVRCRFRVDHDCVHTHAECGISYINQFKAVVEVRSSRVWHAPQYIPCK